MTFQIEIESSLAAGYDHMIVRGRNFDADPVLLRAMESIRSALYAGHSVYERVPLECTTERDFTTKKRQTVAYMRFYRCVGPEFVKPIDRAVGEVVGSSWFESRAHA